MSRTFELACDQCHETLWIGQRANASPTFLVYTADDHPKWLSEFLMRHIEHPLRFFDTERRPDDYREVEHDPDHTTAAED